MIIREGRIDDYKKLAALRMAVENQSPFMLYDPGERIITEESQLQLLQRGQNNPNNKLFVAEVQGELCGFLFVWTDGINKRKHARTIALGVLEDYQGKGIGRGLIKEAILFCKSTDVQRIELTVAATNDRGLALYKKLGFEIEGVKRGGFLISGTTTDEIIMSLLLKE